MENKWFENSYFRTETEMHLGNSDKFLSDYDPEEYADMLTKTNIDATCIFAQNMAGYTFWPTKLGNAHPSLKGRDIMGETLDICHKKGLKMILYFSVIYSHWAYLNHPAWRVIDLAGEPVLSFNGRVGTCCPNSPYRNFVVEQVSELVMNYKFEGIWFDMNQWPEICYCPYCRNRYLEEFGMEIPGVIDWRNAPWVKFQRKREQWLYEFYELVTATVKKINPEISVAHQNGPFGIHMRKMPGGCIELATQSDYMLHDFYGDFMEQSFFSKLFLTLGKSSRFNYMKPAYYFDSQPGVAADGVVDGDDSSQAKSGQEDKKQKLIDWPAALWTASRSEALLEAEVSFAIAHNGAVQYYDNVHCDGTFNESFYEKLGRVYGKLAPYTKYLGGKPCQDVGIYINLESAIDPADNGKPAISAAFHENYFNRREISPEPAISAAKSLMAANIPYGVITKNSLDKLKDFQVIILSNQIMIDEEEAEAFRDFVKNGGSIYASKHTSLLDKKNGSRDNFLMSDLFGVSYLTEKRESLTFCSPSEIGQNYFPGFSYTRPFPIPGPQLRISLNSQTKVLATVTLPYTDTLDPGDKYCHVHTDHPSRFTDYPAVVLKKYGKGKAIYSAGLIEAVQFDPCRDVFIQIVRSLLTDKPKWEAQAPATVEVLVFDQEENRRFLINAVNLQSRVPKAPISGFKIGLNMDSKKTKRVLLLPDKESIDFTQEDGFVFFNTPGFETLLMLSVNY